MGLAFAAAANAASHDAIAVTDKSFGCIRDLKPVRGFIGGNCFGCPAAPWCDQC
jgi:hypothetical protein